MFDMSLLVSKQLAAGSKKLKIDLHFLNNKYIWLFYLGLKSIEKLRRKATVVFKIPNQK